VCVDYKNEDRFCALSIFHNTVGVVFSLVNDLAQKTSSSYAELGFFRDRRTSIIASVWISLECDSHGYSQVLQFSLLLIL